MIKPPSMIALKRCECLSDLDLYQFSYMKQLQHHSADKVVIIEVNGKTDVVTLTSTASTISTLNSKVEDAGAEELQQS